MSECCHAVTTLTTLSCSFRRGKARENCTLVPTLQQKKMKRNVLFIRNSGLTGCLAFASWSSVSTLETGSEAASLVLVLTRRVAEMGEGDKSPRSADLSPAAHMLEAKQGGAVQEWAVCACVLMCTSPLAQKPARVQAEGLVNQHLPTVASASRLWAASSSM